MLNNFLDSDLSKSNEDFFGYNACLTFAGIAVLSYVLPKVTAYATRHYNALGKLEYKDPTARWVANMIVLIMNTFHTNIVGFELDTTKGRRIIALGPHRDLMESFVFASKIKGVPPSFYVTDSFNQLPIIGRPVSAMLNMFEAILVPSKPQKKLLDANKTPAVLTEGLKRLEAGGVVAAYPQGNYVVEGAGDFRVFSGLAKLAIKAKLPIDVLRFDGEFRGLNYTWLPESIRNHMIYRAFNGIFHTNNIEINDARQIKYHLLPENQNKLESALVWELNAQMYAFFEHIPAYPVPKQAIQALNKYIESGKHLERWQEVMDNYTQAKIEARSKKMFAQLKTLRLFKAVANEQEMDEKPVEKASTMVFDDAGAPLQIG